MKNKFSTFVVDFYFWMRGCLGFSKHSKLQKSENCIKLNRAIVLESGVAGWYNEKGTKLVSGVRNRLGTDSVAVPLILRKSNFLKRELVPRHLPRSVLNSITELDVITTSPFDPGEVVAIPRNVALEKYGEIRRSIYYLVRVDSIVAANEFAKLNKRTISCVLIYDDKKIVPLRNSELFDFNIHTNASQSYLTTLMICLVTLAAFSIFTLVHSVYRSQMAITKLMSQNSVLTVKAKNVRKLLAKQSERINRKRSLNVKRLQDRSLVHVWEEVSRILPDSAWITDFELTANKLRLGGYSRSAAGIVPALAGSKMFSNARFSAPIVQILGKKQQRFVAEVIVGSGSSK